MKKQFYIFLIFGFIFSSCQKNTKGCDECGGSILDGYFFNEVKTEDLIVLGEIEGIQVGACIRYKLDGTDFDLTTVQVVDDCCCTQ